jgi:hypothetical protein
MATFSVFLDPSNQVLDEEDPLPPNLVRGKALLHELVKRVMAHT